MQKSAKYEWDHGTAFKRNQMLLNAGIKQRTLTLRSFDDLELETKLDVKYAFELNQKSNKPLGRSSTNSQSSGGFVASSQSSVLIEPAPLALSPGAFFYSQASGR
jgi:hypothetical protein